jgi:hypothetical protein
MYGLSDRSKRAILRSIEIPFHLSPAQPDAVEIRRRNDGSHAIPPRAPTHRPEFAWPLARRSRSTRYPSIAEATTSGVRRCPCGTLRIRCSISVSRMVRRLWQVRFFFARRAPDLIPSNDSHRCSATPTMDQSRQKVFRGFFSLENVDFP